MDQLVFADSKVGKYLRDTFVSIRVVKAKGESDELKKKFHMIGYPTVILLENSGQEIDRIVGFGGDKENFVSTLRNYAAGENTLAVLQQQYQTDTLNVSYVYALAKKHTDRFEPDKAAIYYSRILKLDPQDRRGFGEESRFYVALGTLNSNKNVGPLSSFLKTTSNKKYLSEGIDQLVRFYKSNQDTSQLIAIYENALGKQPDNVNLMNQYAWDIYSMKLKDHYGRGIALAEKAVKLRPKAAGIWDTLAWLYYENGDHEKAVNAMTKAAELEPDAKVFKENLQKITSSL